MASNEESDGERFEPATVDEPSGDEDSHSSHGSDVSEESEVARLLKQLQSSGAIIKKKKEIYRCYTCEEDYLSWHELENHLIQHVSLPWVEVEKLPSDIDSDGDNEMPSDDQWSDEEEQPERPASPENVKPDISAILKNTGITIKKSGDSAPSVGSITPQKLNLPLDKLASLGNIVIKKPASVAAASSSSDVKVEPITTISTSNSDLMQKLGKLGGIKLKLKQTSEGSQNSFKVINGVTATKVEDSQDEWNSEEEEEETEKTNEEDGESEEQSLEEKPAIITKSIPIQPANDKLTITEILTEDEASQPETMEKPSPTDEMSNVSVKTEVETDGGGNANNFPLFTNQIKSERSSPPTALTTVGTPAIANIKRENDAGYQGNASQIQAPNAPVGNLLQGNAAQVQAPNTLAGNLLQGNATQVQAPYAPAGNLLQGNPAQVQPPNAPAGNLLPVLKKEKPSEEPVAIIEINGDSNDEDDDDCCVISATSPPLRDVKPVIFPKTETPGSYPATTTSSYPPISTTQTQSTPILSSRLIVGSSAQTSTEKQHNFNWNAPDTKPEIIEKSADAIFASLLANKPRVESVQSSLEPVSEYISLDRLGSQHTCDVCNTRFTEISLLETHQRTTGHSKSIVAAPGSGMLLPASYGSSNALQSLSNLFPVKQLAEQVGKLSTVGTNSSGAFTHQQNVMINIQSFPGPMGQTVLVPPQPFSNYPGTQPGMTATGPYPNAATNPAYRMAGQPGAGPAYPSQYPNQTPNFHQPYPSNTQMPFGQESQMAYQTNTSQPNAQYGMSSGGYTMQGQLGPGQYTQSPMGQMGSPQAPALSLPGQAPSPGQYGPAASPSANAGIKIQNIQTFSPGAGQQVRPAGPRGPAPGGPRGRAPGARPTIRPGIQVHGQAGRGGKPTGPRMPLKRAAGPPQAGAQKRRLDVLLPGRHDNEDCQVMSMQRQRDGLPTIQSVQGSRDKLGLGSQISVTRKTVNREANAMADVLAQRGIMVKAKTQAPVPRIPGLGSGVSIKRSSDGNFTIPEARVGGGMLACKVCKKMFSSPSSLSAHMLAAHPQYRPPAHRCEECPASYPKAAQLQHHRRVFHNVSGPERELGLPVVDLSQEENLRKLSELGIYSFIPLANREQASGCFGIPVISVHGSHNGMVSSLQALGADGLLSLGPLKPLPNS